MLGGGRRAEPSSDRSRDITYIGRDLCELGNCMACCISSLHMHGIRASFVCKCRRPSDARGALFFAYSSLIIIFKGELMKLTIVALAKAYFYDYFDVLLLSYKPSNFAWAILPYAAGQRVNKREAHMYYRNV